MVVFGPVVATALGWAWLAIDADGQAPGTTTLQRIGQAFVGLVGLDGPVRFVSASDGRVRAVALAVLGASVLMPTDLVALHQPAGPHPARRLRADACETCSTAGRHDSLSYFTLRGDRWSLFSKSGKSAVLPRRRHRDPGRGRPAR